MFSHGSFADKIVILPTLTAELAPHDSKISITFPRLPRYRWRLRGKLHKESVGRMGIGVYDLQQPFFSFLRPYPVYSPLK